MPDVFVIQKQTEDKWCWAAVSLSIARYYNPHSTLSQCSIARLVLGDGSRNCCVDPEACNQAEDLDVALKKTGCFRDSLPRALEFSEIVPEINANRPIGVRIGWRAGGGHFVILMGYRVLASGIQQVEVADPFFPNTLTTYNHFVNAYGSGEQPGGGQWTDTYFVQKGK